MVRRIVWTSLADKIFTSVLEFYIKRNGSKTYSRKLNNEIHTTISLLKKSPFLGAHTELENIRVLIYKSYKIFYQVDADEIIVHLVWDTRQDTQKLEDLLS
jgi:toxin YoeB